MGLKFSLQAKLVQTRGAALTEKNYERWRRDRDFHAWKSMMHREGCRMPTQNQDG